MKQSCNDEDKNNALAHIGTTLGPKPLKVFNLCKVR